MTLEANDRQDSAAPALEVHLPGELAQWATLFAAAGARHAVDPLLVAAVCSRESGGGTAPGYHPHGPAGTGDWTARTGHWLKESGVRVVTELPPGWHAPRSRSGLLLPPPYAIPDDGQGWGRGLMQIDFVNALGIDWRDPAVNIDKGAQMLAALLAEFPRAPRSAIAAYNCGAKGVRRALLMGKGCDFLTTGRDYSADVMRRRASYLKEPKP